MEHEVRGTEGSDVKRSKLHHFLLIPIIALTLLVSPALQGKEKKPEPDRVIPGDYDVWSLDWAPDGRIAFCGKQEGEAGTETRIWLYRPEQAKPVLWTGTGSLIDFAPKWAPDGSGVVMVRKTAPTPERREFATGIWWKRVPFRCWPAAYFRSSGPRSGLVTIGGDPCFCPGGRFI